MDMAPNEAAQRLALGLSAEKRCGLTLSLRRNCHDETVGSTKPHVTRNSKFVHRTQLGVQHSVES